MSESKTLLIGISFSCFIALGLPSGLLGVAWPSIRGTFNIPLDALGALLITATLGFLLSSFNSGRISSYLGVGPFLMVSNILAGIGLLGYALSPTWSVMVLCSFLEGLGAGGMDAGVNAYFAMNYSTRLMNWLHASFGLGATLGPLIMTTVLSMGQSWRYGYAVAIVLQGLLALCYGLTLDRWHHSDPGPDAISSGPSVERASSVSTLKLPIVWLTMLLFLMLAGIEIAAGQWVYTLFTEARSIAPSIAGIWTSIYWGSFTAGRLFFGLVVNRIGIVNLLRLTMLGVICGAIFIWLNVTAPLSFLGLALVGLALAPIFPSLVSVTPEGLGVAHAANAIGFQVSAANLGAAILPGLVGVLAKNLGLETIGPFLVATSVVMFLLHETVQGELFNHE
jgi:fucose permease